ncbi:cupin domain-containing protein [Rhodococcus sp. Z13]|uniref:Cupin domain-containing protein n=1 Tax=Rhodococcus sacchari TaxID=2962047 RepID=A0ACD4DHU0_9NOCA|nr:cupin domain-containing protein [Rhodococcus sp. Z13]UYP19548.1 cupin domain-containing protein [Rhodococcus sp. Z13]
MSNIAGPRHLGVMAADLDPRERTQPEAGDISSRVVWTESGQSHGIWQMTPGTLQEVRGPESVALLAGRARVTVHPSGEVFEIAAGDVFVIDNDETATWEVLETVRKFFVVNR